MTEQTPRQSSLQAALSAVTDLAERVTTLTAEVVRLRTYGRHNRKFVIADIVLTLAIAGLGYLSVHANSTAQQNGVTISQLHATQVSGCRSGNVTRAQEITLWNHLAAVSTPSPGETKKEIAKARREVAAFLAYVAKTFAPRDCNALYKLPG